MGAQHPKAAVRRIRLPCPEVVCPSLGQTLSGGKVLELPALFLMGMGLGLPLTSWPARPRPCTSYRLGHGTLPRSERSQGFRLGAQTL